MTTHRIEVVTAHTTTIVATRIPTDNLMMKMYRHTPSMMTMVSIRTIAIMLLTSSRMMDMAEMTKSNE